jgi:hypothetical protein
VAPRPSFDRLWTRLRAALRPGGVVAVDLVGVNDSWAGNPEWTFLTVAGATALADGLVVEHWDERDEDGLASSEPKHWHAFEPIARHPR